MIFFLQVSRSPPSGVPIIEAGAEKQTNNEQGPKEGKERQVCTYALVLAVGIVLLAAALYSQDEDGYNLIFTMTDFDEYRMNNSIWFSPPVYTAPRGGYKIRLCVYANGYGSGEGTHVSVGVHFLRGDFDDSLEWPFCGTIFFRLVDQLHGRDHREYTAIYNETIGARVTERDGAHFAVGQIDLITHFELVPNYLLDNTLQFQYYLL